jgi:S-DNA-T family DNA segregation ATPase FtsK/SpoIIIE
MHTLTTPAAPSADRDTNPAPDWATPADQSADPPAPVPVGPMLSMFDPLFLGIDEFGAPVYIELIYRNLLAGGEPGGGKSGLLNTITAHAALAADTRLVLLDGKLVELGPWAPVADKFVGPDIDDAITTLKRLQQVMNNRYAWLLANGRRKIAPADRLSVIVVIVDEIAFYSATVGTKQQQEEFVALLRDLVARGRACGIPVVAATQRPSFDIIPTSLRDLFGYRAAFRCTTTNSSNIVLGHGWAEQGYTATDISPTNQGAAYLIAEGGTPRRIKVSYLTDADVAAIADYAAWIRRPTGGVA